MRTAFVDYPALAALLRDAAIKLVDVGGRGSAFAPLLPLAACADYYVSEPDRIEAERLKRQLPLEAPWRTVTVLTEAIASRVGEAQLYLTSPPGMSSLLEPNPEVTKRFYLEEKFRVVETMTVPTIPLDEAASHYGFADATFLKMDTQGTELDILQSGPRLVSGSLLGIHTESNFHPFYKGQALFSDVDSYLRKNGFALFSLNRTALRRSGYRESLYSRRVVTWAHCLYLREPESLLSADHDVLRRNLSRLLGLSLAFEHYDLSFEMLAIFRRVRLLADHDLDRLADDIERVAMRGTQRMLRKAKEKEKEKEKETGLANALLAPNFRDKKRLE